MTIITGRIPRDANHVPLLAGVSNSDLTTPVLVAVDPATNRLLVQSTGTVTITGVATASNQTSGSQKTQIVTSTGANIDKNEDAAHTSGDSGVMALGVRNDLITAPVTFSDTNGDYTPVGLTKEGYVQATNAVLEVPFSTTTAQAVGTTDCTNYRWVSVHLVTSGTNATCSWQGSNNNTNWVSVNLHDMGSTYTSSDNQTNIIWSGPLEFRYFRINVTGISAGTTAGVIEFFGFPITGRAIPVVAGNSNFSINNLQPGTAPSQFGKAEDQAHVSGDVGVATWGVRNDAQTTFTDTDGDYSPIATDGPGNLRVVGNIAHDGVDAGAPVKIGGKASNTAPTAVSAADRVNAWFDLNGRQVVASGLVPLGASLVTYSVRITTNTTTTPTSATAYISSIVISSEIAGTTSTLTIQDKQGTPLKLVNGLTTVALTTTPTVINLQSPIVMTSGIDIITAGVGAATVDVWIDYYQ